MISIQHLSAGYQRSDSDKIQDVSFEIQDGQTLVLLGPNGAGKSTLLKCVLSLLRPRSGDVLYDGKSVFAMKPRERSRIFAYMPQNIRYSPMSVYDFVMLGRLPYFALGPDEEDRIEVMNALLSMEIEHLVARNVTELSGGERQKVAFARALAQQARVLVFDEPTSNLDVAAEIAATKMISALSKKRGLTVLLSMHDLNLALTLGDRFALLKEGRLLAHVDSSGVDEAMVERVFGIRAKRVQIDNQNFFVYGGNEQ